MKCLGQEVGAARDENGASHRRRQPFVRIDGDRVGAFDTVKHAAQAIRRQCRAAPGRVDVQPERLLFRDVGAGVQRVDHARAGGSGRGNDHDRNRSRGAVLGNGLEQRLGVHPAVAVGIHQPQCAAADAGLMRYFQPRDMAIPGCIEFHRPGEGAHAVGGKIGMGGGQCADQRCVVCLGSAGGKVSRRVVAECGTARHRADHMAFQCHGHGRGSRTRELRIERSSEPIRALRRKIGAGIEEPEIARVRHLHDALFQALDRPAQCVLQRLRLLEVETIQLGAKLLHVDGRRDRAGLHAPMRRRQLERQPVADPLSVRRIGK